MAPALLQGFLVRRQNNINGDYENCDAFGCYSTWDNWGRWVALAVIIVAIILLAFLFSCFNNRRRRQRGAPPMYGTGWMPYGKPPPGHNQAYYNYNQAAPPPPYMGNQATGTTFNSNEGYYGHHNVQPQTEYNQDIELQQPQTSYMPQRGGDPVYEAPQGAPPKKGDGIIR
ncbi:uncharacterized protein LY89DRAFT_667549 [Mollisia scopiformis]|uniref:Uncharacterized protein n=1 Tax=Mollisia scopiformis TaxID=149040 RepID=A0A194XFB3_MOLSC|nr:uncharacterized protein LY89DRAFT_667549 [Mollisia scopiformis]KUJ18457.1 hypothetical protein LY89DRAFT_667549 [Mollisia scopiformis]